jgi:hypothetical protein
MPTESLEPRESRRLRYLELAAEALRAASQSKEAAIRDAYILVAHGWLDLANSPGPHDAGTP